MEFGIYDINDFKNIDYKTRLNLYKKVGFSSIGLYIDNNYMLECETYEEIISYAKAIGLKINQVHICYKFSNDICENLSNYIQYVEEKLKVCEKYNIKNMVLHASKGDNPPKISNEALKQIETLATSHKQVNLAFENVRNNENLIKILNLNVPNITFCFDLGHANAYNSLDLLDTFKHKISCSHLHNNFGKDEHNLLSNGEISYKPIVRKLSTLNADLCLEVFPEKNTDFSIAEFEDFVSKAFKDTQF